jgi:hypothetical protein
MRYTKPFLWLLAGLVLCSGCTWFKFTHKDEIARQKQKIVDLKHQLGLSHFVNGVSHELFNEYNDAI